MAAKLFLCYRRDDSAHFAGRVQDRLGSEFGRDLLFMDVDTIPLGLNFSKVLREEVAKCRVLLAMIGPNWLDAVDKDGNRRLDDPNDFVRIEIAAALRRDIPVIPILLDGARVPKADELPKVLGELSMRNGLDVRHASFHDDIDRLVRNLKGQLGGVDAEERRRDGDERRLARAGEDTAEWQRLQGEEKNRLQEEEKTKEKRGRVRAVVASAHWRRGRLPADIPHDGERGAVNCSNYWCDFCSVRRHRGNARTTRRRHSESCGDSNHSCFFITLQLKSRPHSVGCGHAAICSNHPCTGRFLRVVGILVVFDVAS